MAKVTRYRSRLPHWVGKRAADLNTIAKTQSQIARETGIRRATINRWMDSNELFKDPDMNVAGKLAKLFGISAKDMIEEVQVEEKDSSEVVRLPAATGF